MEEGVKEYDLGNSLDALQLAFIVSRLTLDTESVEKAFTSTVLEKNKKRFEGDAFPQWTMMSQTEQYAGVIFPKKEKKGEQQGEVEEPDQPPKDDGNPTVGDNTKGTEPV
jgi:hypothetical protein